MTHYPKVFIYDLDGVITDTAEFALFSMEKTSRRTWYLF